MNLLPLDRLPLLPDHTLKAHKAYHPYDTRFRAAARLKQTLWREAQGLPQGTYTTTAGSSRKLGSRLSAFGAAAGGNFISQPVHRLAQRDYAYREPGAAIDEHRLFGNLLCARVQHRRRPCLTTPPAGAALQLPRPKRPPPCLGGRHADPGQSRPSYAHRPTRRL